MKKKQIFVKSLKTLVDDAIKLRKLFDKKKALTTAGLVLAFCGFSMLGNAQTLPNNVYAVGPSYNSSGTPEVAGSALYAHLCDANMGLYCFSAFDATPTSLKPLTVVTSVGAGVAKKAFNIGKFPVYIPLDAGFAWNGKNMGWAWHGGALASVKLYDNFHAYPAIRFGSSSVSNGSGIQPIFSIFLGYEK